MKCRATREKECQVAHRIQPLLPRQTTPPVLAQPIHPISQWARRPRGLRTARHLAHRMTHPSQIPRAFPQAIAKLRFISLGPVARYAWELPDRLRVPSPSSYRIQKALRAPRVIGSQVVRLQPLAESGTQAAYPLV